MSKLDARKLACKYQAKPEVLKVTIACHYIFWYSVQVTTEKQSTLFWR